MLEKQMKLTESKLRRIIRKTILEATKVVSPNLDGDSRQVMGPDGKPMKVTQYWKQDRIGPQDWSYEFNTPRPQQMADNYIKHYEEKGLDEDIRRRLKRYYESMRDKDKEPMHELILASGHEELIDYIESLNIDWN